MHRPPTLPQTVGIDTYCWLHKGIYSCSAELCQGIPTDKFIKYCVERSDVRFGKFFSRGGCSMFWSLGSGVNAFRDNG